MNIVCISVLLQINISNTQKMHQKVVDNYQFEESKKYLEDGIETYLARHVNEGQHYLLKKVNTKDQTDRKKYQILINQVGILKTISHPFIAECLKMLKTSNNIYLVYDYCEGQKLDEMMSQPNKITFEERLQITKNLITALEKLASAHIIHGNLQPKSIIVGEKGNIKLMNFLFAHNIENKTEMNLKVQPPSSEYTAPEISESKIIYGNSDIYSLGVILSKLFENDMEILKKRGVSEIIDEMKSEKAEGRPSIQKIKQIFNNANQNKDRARKKSAEFLSIKDQRLTKLKKPKSLQNDIIQTSSRKSERNSNSDIPSSQKKFVEQILKRRNLALFLLELSENCLGVDNSQTNFNLFLGCVLLKISTRIITRLLGFLKLEPGHENQITVHVLREDNRKSFEKKSDFFKLLTIINKQSKTQQKWLQQIMKSVSSQLDKEQKATLSSELVPDSQLKGYIIEYLKGQISDENHIAALSQNQILHLYLMSQIISHGSFEKLFDELISEQKISLDEQYLYVHARKMSKQKAIEQIRSRINKRR